MRISGMRISELLIVFGLAAGCSASPSHSPADGDGDGYTTVDDCNDGDAAVHPGAAEICGDGIDQDCVAGDLACAACTNGMAITSSCLCAPTGYDPGKYDTGYCCDDAWQSGACNSPGDTTAPAISNGTPTGVLTSGTTQVTIQVTTDEAATCKWSSTPGSSYAAMANTFATTGSTSHSTVLAGLVDGQSYTRYVRCQDGANNANTSDYLVSFTINTPPGSNQCNDGLDNDGDGLVDWEYDLGCEDQAGASEFAGPRSVKNGWTTFDPDAQSRFVYVSSSDGQDTNDGLSPASPKRSVAAGEALIRRGEYDFLLFKRGDIWRDETMGRIVDGRDATHPYVIASYGISKQRPRFENAGLFINPDGQTNHDIAILGLELYGYTNDPNDPAFSGGVGEAGFRFVGNGENILLEDIKITYGTITVQSYGSGEYSNVELHRNIVTLNYHDGTCGQSNTYRPSGTFASHINGFVIAENMYDHNGWNEDVAGACSSMYNHNFYMTGIKDLVMKDNLITRASSIGIKTTSNNPQGPGGNFQRALIENNFIYQGEVAMSIGGNDAGDYRYSDITVRGNVTSEVGQTNPSGRQFSWGLDAQDWDGGLIEGNYFLQQPLYTNSYSLVIQQPTFRDVTIRANIFYNIEGNALSVSAQTAWSNIQITANRFLGPPAGSCLVRHLNGFASIAYSDNGYQNTSDNEFCVGNTHYSLSEWAGQSGETNARTFVGTLLDPARTLGRYASSLGYANVPAFLTATQNQSRFNWKPALTAPAVNAYIKAGFELQ